ncbi:MAG: hypothetical protein ACW99E_07375 [Promethearchaeota archaeon]
MLTSWVPPEKGRLLGKTVVEAASEFADVENDSTELVIQAVTTDEYGIRAFAISEIKEGKTRDAMIQASRLAIFYADKIGEGFKYKIETLMSAIEAMQAIGLEMPQQL